MAGRKSSPQQRGKKEGSHFKTERQRLSFRNSTLETGKIDSSLHICPTISVYLYLMGKHHLLSRRPGNRKSTSSSLLRDKLFCRGEWALPQTRVPQSPGRLGGQGRVWGSPRGAGKEARPRSDTRTAPGLSRDRKGSSRSALPGTFLAIKSLSNLALKTQGRKHGSVIKQSKKLNLSYSGAPRRELAISCKIPCELMT